MEQRQQVLLQYLSEAGFTIDSDNDTYWLVELVNRMLQAQAEHASFELSWQRFCGSVVRAIQHATPPLTPREWMAQSQLSDLYFVEACLAQDKAAIQAFQASFDRVLRAIVRRFAKPPLMPEELYQELWIRLFVQTETRKARLASYAAQGPLLSWLRITAVRACIDYTRTHHHLKYEQVVQKEHLFEIPQEVLDVELEFLKREYHNHFRMAFAEAIKQLPSHDRLLLRYHVVEKLSIDQIGVLVQCHRSTAARRLQQARQHLLEATEERLTQRLHISQEEFQNIIGLIQSRWEVSVQRLLQHSQLSGEL